MSSHGAGFSRSSSADGGRARVENQRQSRSLRCAPGPGHGRPRGHDRAPGYIPKSDRTALRIAPHHLPPQPGQSGTRSNLAQARQPGSWTLSKRALRGNSSGGDLERVAGIEPARSAWEADRLPLHHTRRRKPSTPAARRAQLQSGASPRAWTSSPYAPTPADQARSGTERETPVIPLPHGSEDWR